MTTKRTHSSGFTLLEVMLAVTILGLVLTAVYGIWNTSLTAWKRGVAVSDSLQRGRVVLDTVEDLARSIEYYPSKPELYLVTGTRDANGSAYVSFVTTSDALLPVKETTALGMRRVALAMSRGEDGEPFLGIANQPALADASLAKDTVWQVLSRDVVAFAARYRNPKDGTWTEEWGETNLVPSAIQFTVAFAQGTPGASPIVVTRAVDLPGATYALEILLGAVPSAQNTTNEVTLPDITLGKDAAPQAEEGGR